MGIGWSRSGLGMAGGGRGGGEMGSRQAPGPRGGSSVAKRGAAGLDVRSLRCSFGFFTVCLDSAYCNAKYRTDPLVRYGDAAGLHIRLDFHRLSPRVAEIRLEWDRPACKGGSFAQAKAAGLDVRLDLHGSLLICRSAPPWSRAHP